jgi:hypothetical protein
MTRNLMIAVAAVVALGATAWAGGPPPVYVVVDKVTTEPGAGAPERITIHGSFVRLENVPDYTYGKPVQGCVYLSLEAGKEAECRAEWAKWQQAAGTGKAVAVGSCGRAGSLLSAKIHKPGERAGKPDAAYSTGYLGAIGQLYADANWEREPPVRDLLAFVKAQKAADQRR